MAKIAIIHSEADQKSLTSFIKQLSPLIRNKLIRDIWYSNKLKPGDDVLEITKNQLSKSHIIVILLSSDFFASDECYSLLEYSNSLYIEKPYLDIIPVICKDCAWKECEILTRYRVLSVDKDLSLKNKEDSFLEVIDVLKGGIHRVRETEMADYYYLKKTTFSVLIIRINNFFFTYGTWKDVLTAIFKIIVIATILVIIIAINGSKLNEMQLIVAASGSLFISILAYTITDIFREKWKTLFTLPNLILLLTFVSDNIKDAINKIINLPEDFYTSIKNWLNSKNNGGNNAGL